MSRSRNVATVALLVVQPMLLSVGLLRRELRTPEVAHGVIDAQVARYQELLESLPAPGRIGYLSDEPRDAGRTVHGVPFTDFLIAAYALRPWHLVPRPEGPRVVGQFRDPAAALPAAAANGLVVERDFGDGVYLLRR